jgi:hypothetical protein
MDKIKKVSVVIFLSISTLVGMSYLLYLIHNKDDNREEVMTYTYHTDSTQVIVEGKELKVTINHVNK